MEYFYALSALLSGLGAFLLGFKIISDSMGKKAFSGFSSVLGKASNNRLFGVGAGMTVTAAVQSSSITTVMVVGLVNAGTMTLYQATAVIMGANIGTTVTAQIAALQSFSIVEAAMLFTFIGTILFIFFSNDKIKTAGYALAGFGLVFMGLKFMSGAMVVFEGNKIVESAFGRWQNPFILFLVGMLITALIQSSSAVNSVLITMAAAGFTVGNGGNSVYYVILGTNVGSCVTAMIAAAGTCQNAKRAALIHLMFNVFGAALFLCLMLPWKSFAADTFEKWFPHRLDTQIAMFHTFHNVICTLIFLPFIKVFVRISEIVIGNNKKIKPALSGA